MNMKLKNAIYGFAIADALGVPFEFMKRGTFKCTSMVGYGTWNQSIGTWSDDTSMTIATCKSIKDNNRIVLADIMNNFKLWYDKAEFTAHSKVFDIGMTTQSAIHTGKPATDFLSNGNGSLMRILPLAFITCTNDDIINVSALTHAHEISEQACVIYVSIAKSLLEGQGINDILNHIDYPEPFNRLTCIYNLSEDRIKSSGYVVDTLEAALWCLSTTNTYKDCVLKAINLGSDTDTIAAVAGGLAGIVYGLENIPNEWINLLVNKNLIDDCLF